ncbi:PIN domain-containing protein [Bradyrhizobium sp. SZCCHNRI1003]|uniref:PIN domain-containing protein n=1 Tax=Bradyrhizobium sp. SZCCHNRI1003 TaxID=3057275 RepID=UPI002916B449|nr:PIN domain-containing protein [Bradyrhizobium sp. SZCCHNRI1003]
MFKLLIDTCVWLDLAKDHQQKALLGALEGLVKNANVSLILPRTVVDEFARNKAKIAEQGRHSLSSTLKRVRDAAEKLGDRARKRVVIEYLSDLDHKLPSLGENAIEGIGRIEKLFAAVTVVETSDAIKLRAAQRAIDGRAPFHRQKNSMNDAILIETYAEVAADRSAKGIRCAFVTHNTHDFSATNTNNKLPHPDTAGYFSRIKSLYFITLGEALRRVEPGLLSEIMIEQEWVDEPRRLTEILDAIDLLFHQVWYNRHMNTRYRIEAGETKIVEKETFPVKDHSKRPIQRDVWEGALKAATRVEKKYGLQDLGPWDDFEWGMINGKLSALRWVLGDEWDMLDT